VQSKAKWYVVQMHNSDKTDRNRSETPVGKSPGADECDGGGVV